MKIKGSIQALSLKPNYMGADEKFFTLTIGGTMKSEDARQIYNSFRKSEKRVVFTEHLTPDGLEVEIEIQE